MPLPLLDDLLSEDSHRIWSAACAIRRSRDFETLKLLSLNLELIEESTKKVALGGGLRPNASHLDFAIRKLGFVKTSTSCLCGLYAMDDQYNPVEEMKAGNISISSTVLAGGEWIDYYDCSCMLCGARFHVEEREYHYTWWAWKPA